jgi:hypothetical protein
MWHDRGKGTSRVTSGVALGLSNHQKIFLRVPRRVRIGAGEGLGDVMV